MSDLPKFREWLNVNEASLSRFWQHLNNHEPIIVISAERSDKSKQENDKNTKELRRSINASKFGFAKILGGYVETLENGETKDVDGEKSSAVFCKPEDEKILLKLGMILGTQYDQDSFLFIDKNGNAKWIYTANRNGNKIGDVEPLGKFHPNKIPPYYSKIGKKQFSYSVDENVEENNYNSIERQMNDIFYKELRVDETFEEYLQRKKNKENILNVI